MTVLIAGGAGFIGGNFVLDWLAGSRKLPQTVNNMKIETSISLEMRDEEVEIYGSSRVNGLCVKSQRP
jgi:dTDP-glucose 4,6-dehydratase